MFNDINEYKNLASIITLLIFVVLSVTLCFYFTLQMSLIVSNIVSLSVMFLYLSYKKIINYLSVVDIIYIYIAPLLITIFIFYYIGF